MKHRWLALLSAALLLAGASPARAEGGWSALWRTPDQRGEAELRAGDAAAAARSYTDPRRKAYAQLKAGDFRGAAETYAAVDAAEAFYNQGNALARAGDLRQALQAYDAALARDPGDADAQRNRDLVRQALQPPPPRPGPGRQPSPLAGGPGAQPPAQPASGPPGRAQTGLGSAAGSDRAPGASASDRSAGLAEPNPVSGNGTAAAGSADPAGAPGSAEAANGTGADPAPLDDAAQAQRDVLGGARRPAAARDPRDPKPLARSEQQLAEEQWLRRLPDDPGGLLRRKFLIQHLIRQGTPP